LFVEKFFDLGWSRLWSNSPGVELGYLLHYEFGDGLSEIFVLLNNVVDHVGKNMTPEPDVAKDGSLECGGPAPLC